MRKELVVFSIPTVDGNISAPLMLFTRLCEKQSENPNVRWRFQTNIVEGYKPTEYARNRLVQRFLEDPEAVKMWFFDADVKPPIPQTMDLLGVQADIAAGIYPVWGSKPGEKPTCRWTAYDRKPGGKFFHMDVEGLERPFHAEGAATGCMIIHRRVLEDPRMHLDGHFEHPLTGEKGMLSEDEPPAVFQWPRYPNGKTMMTDDFDFCYRARSLGYSLKIHPVVRCGHKKRVDLMDILDFSRIEEGAHAAA